MTSTSGSTDSPSTSDASSSTDSSTGSSSSTESSTGSSHASSTGSFNSSSSTLNYNTTTGSGPGDFWFSYSTLIEFSLFLFYDSYVIFHIQNLVPCGTGHAYLSGTSIDEPIVPNRLECRYQCALNFNCQFWDYGASNPNVAKTCTLRSDKGLGLDDYIGFYGTWNCIFEGIIKPF